MHRFANIKRTLEIFANRCIAARNYNLDISRDCIYLKLFSLGLFMRKPAKITLFFITVAAISPLGRGGVAKLGQSRCKFLQMMVGAAKFHFNHHQSFEVMTNDEFIGDTHAAM